MTRADVLLGIDVGTTELKLAAFDALSGRALAATAHRLAVRTDSAGAREQDPADVLRGVARAARELRARLGGRWRRVLGIGLAAQGGSAILADRETGRALTPMQLWNDPRPFGLLPGIAARKPAGYWRRLSGLDGPGAGLARIEWLRRRHPRLVPSGRRQARTLYCGAGEYAFFGLTGAWRQDAGNAVQIGCYSVARRALVPGPLETVGVALDFVAPLRAGHETHPLSRAGSRLLGLPEGVPVAGPYIDHEAGYMSAAGLGGRPLQCSLGTAWVGNFTARATPPRSWGLDLVLPSPVDDGQLVLRVMRAGNVTWDWGVDALAGGRRSGAMQAAEAVLADELLPPEGLVSFPWFTLPNRWDAAKPGNGAFLGLNAGVTRADLLRALAAGMAFEFAGLFAAMRRGGRLDRVVLGGGAGRGRGFQQLLAALFAPLPVSVALDQSLAGARGSVYAFAPRAARSAERRVPRPDARLRRRVEAQFERYARVRSAVMPA